MKTILAAIFAIAVMVFAFNATPSYASEESDKKVHDFFFPPSVGTGCVNQETGAIMEGTTDCEQYLSNNEIDELNDIEDVADSGEEGSTSAAGVNEQ
ncbi:MAG: hypothetical protein OXF09_03545 [Hyphomicrobiales bacterium]|nr:hypothetical protein [Hyphomicrobiales bacterium]